MVSLLTASHNPGIDISCTTQPIVHIIIEHKTNIVPLLTARHNQDTVYSYTAVISL